MLNDYTTDQQIMEITTIVIIMTLISTQGCFQMTRAGVGARFILTAYSGSFLLKYISPGVMYNIAFIGMCSHRGGF